MEINKAMQQELRAVAEEMADTARKVTLRYFRTRDLAIENKEREGFDPVTVADREAEQAMRAVLARRRPEDAIFGEEFGHSTGSSGLTWVLDPIDGTRAFISGAPSWGVLIGLEAGQGPVLGLIDQPFTGERFFGGFGQADWRRGTEKAPLNTRPCRRLEDAILMTTFPEVGTGEEEMSFNAVSARCKLTRFGLDCYAYALLALGQIDLVIEAGLNAYDVQGPIGVVEGAGGVVTDWQGNPAHNGGQIIAAGDAQAHAAALEILNR
ncbi:MAG: histidinol-phosphatase [Rhodobacteraceae bacterium]|nr:histidinol-phosphatase [Paracoccaceae bacterium]